MKWRDHTYEEVKASEYLLAQFGAYYYKVYGKDFCVTCDNFSNEFQTLLNMKENKSKYRLKEMYNGLPLGKGEYAFNVSLTDEQAEQLLDNHPRGVELFDVMPSQDDEDNEITSNLSTSDDEDNENNSVVEEADSEIETSSEDKEPTIGGFEEMSKGKKRRK